MLQYKHMTLAIGAQQYLPCYAKSHNVNIFQLKKLLMLTNGIILAISGHDTFRPLGIKLGPLQKVYVTLNTINGVVICTHLHLSGIWQGS